MLSMGWTVPEGQPLRARSSEGIDTVAFKVRERASTRLSCDMRYVLHVYVGMLETTTGEEQRAIVLSIARSPATDNEFGHPEWPFTTWEQFPNYLMNNASEVWPNIPLPQGLL